ncbi:hypothetical protein GH733_005877 [Mirounga leonina]|nr:hypothetical protein GH733_005877 [Mirounga leonina]
MAKQKAAPEAKKQKVEATEPTTSFNLFVGNLNFSKSARELKTGISDLFAKNDLVVVGVRIGVSRKFGYVDFESAEDLEKALELTGLQVSGNEIKLEKPKGKDKKGQSHDSRGGKNSRWSGESKTLVLSSLSYNATEETLQEVFEKATFIKVPQNQNGKFKGYAFIEFASFEDAKEALNSCNKREIEGRAIRLELQGPSGSSNARSQPSKTLSKVCLRIPQKRH